MIQSGKTSSFVPPQRSENLLVEQIDAETVIYDLTSKEAHCLKPLAGFVFAHADGRSTFADLATRAEAQMGRTVDENEIADAVAQLLDRSLLDVPLAISDGLSRRDVVRRAGAVAFAAPLITSIVAPTMAMAVSGIATGCAGCGKNSDCVSNHCCQSNAGKQCSQGCCVGANNSCHFCNCVSNTCDCTVTPAEAGITVCPCICGTSGCVNVPCCPSVNTLCCTNIVRC